MVKTQREIALIRFNRAKKALMPPWRIQGHDIWQFVPFVYQSERVLKNLSFQRATKHYVDMNTNNKFAGKAGIEAIIKNKKLLSDIQSGLVQYATGVNMNLPIANNIAFPNGVVAKLQETIAWQENYPTFIKNWEATEQIARQKDELLLLTDKQRADLFYSNLEKEKREKELQKAINIEIQNEMQPIDIEILPTIVKPITVKPITVKPITVKPITVKTITVKPLDIDDVTKISITSALAIGLVSYLVLTR